MKSSSDDSLYLRKGLYLLIYVDDLLLVGDRETVNAAKKELLSLYKMTDLGLAKRFLGISIERDRANRTIKVHQKAYIEGLLERYGLENCNPVSTPMQPGTTLSRNDGKPLVGKEVTWYKQLVGSLQCAAWFIRFGFEL
jgi:hypothetical protein